ncbi:hypothetical protein SOVF_146100 [Spinacia oleracea]|uniref:Precursor of CEP14 n=1 Tax=Spinacia oleracea TaxID=3562 RepID=A0A9R0IVA4_SPIOL|nr:precursor of CEP14 [Spinacia oleracea]KNA10261.1 hypothetical protein SOVF_146100 [Spinacia oleracea]
MARATAIVIIVALVFVGLLSMFTAPIEAARVLKETQKALYIEDTSLVTNALPKGTIPHSAPVLSETRKLFVAVHRSSDQLRYLQSVPSPGVGHH